MSDDELILDAAERDRLKAAGWVSTTPEDWLGLDDEERREVERRLQADSKRDSGEALSAARRQDVREQQPSPRT
ncbi:MAG: hypothetical protein AAFY15_08570 [Cyanobacteria bacterium J06648_11]